VAHELLASPTINITQPGYVYIYLSNENATPVDVYFDDFKYTHVKSSVVAGADYYPFGLPMENREITREDYRYGYQGKYAEKDDETGWGSFTIILYLAVPIKEHLVSSYIPSPQSYPFRELCANEIESLNLRHECPQRDT
jgi:hypothetical protein